MAPRATNLETTEPGQRIEPKGTRRRRTGRLLGYLLTIFVLITLNFFLPRAMPGDPISALQDQSSRAYVSDSVTRSALAHYYGLDRPLLRQYGRYLVGLGKGDLGTSVRYRRPVTGLLAERLPWSLLLGGSAMVMAASVGLWAGVHSGWRRDRAVDRGLLSVFVGLRNFPVFLLASFSLYFFSVKLGWFPVAGAQTPFIKLDRTGRALDVVRHLVLPATVLAIQFAGGHYMVMRSSMVEELGADYLLLGRAKGVTDRRLKYRYAARNALLPVVTLTALELGFIVTGAVFVERVFAYPGLGQLLFDSISARDYPTLQGCFLVITTAVVSLNALAEALYRRLDPRIAA